MSRDLEAPGAFRPAAPRASDPSVEELLNENRKLRKINAALMSRVERSMDHQLNAFALFETAIALESQVRRRTQELQQALRSLERSNEALSRSKIQAEAANSSKTTFLASVSHDLLQPLNAARLALSALNGSESASASSLIGQVNRALATLEELIRTLLDISKLDAGVLAPEVGPVRVNDVLEPLAQEFAPIAEKRGLRLSVRPSRAVVLSDPLMLRRILQNLLANALRYTRRGGVVLGCRSSGSMLRIVIADTGPGIADSRREAIFEMFQRDDVGADGETGFGLGLSIVRRLAMALEHRVDLASRLGHGSMFSISAPRLPDAPQPAAEPTRAAPPDYGVKGATVLLIENEPSVAEAMESVLSRWGCTVARATSGEEALRSLAGAPYWPDIIVADLHLDDGELGYDAVARVQAALGRQAPGFIITADHSARASSAIASRGFEVLHKPVKPAELRSLMAYLLA